MGAKTKTAKGQLKDYSQFGETTIIANVVEKMRRRLHDLPKIAVEIGAGDGFHLSNIRGLLEDGWKGLQLDKNPPMSQTTVHVCHVTAENVNRELMLRMPAVDPYDSEIGVLSIDVDGNDYWIWKAFTTYHPYVVAIEFNPSLVGSKTIFYDPEHNWDGTNYFGASFDALRKLGHSKGYKCIARTDCNLIFARSDMWMDPEPLFLHVSVESFPATDKQFQEVI